MIPVSVRLFPQLRWRVQKHRFSRRMIQRRRSIIDQWRKLSGRLLYWRMNKSQNALAHRYQAWVLAPNRERIWVHKVPADIMMVCHSASIPFVSKKRPSKRSMIRIFNQWKEGEAAVCLLTFMSTSKSLLVIKLWKFRLEPNSSRYTKPTESTKKKSRKPF